MQIKSPEKKSQSKDKKEDNEVRMQQKEVQKEKRPPKTEQKNGHGVFLNEIRNEQRHGSAVMSVRPPTADYTDEESEEKREGNTPIERQSKKEKAERKKKNEESKKKEEFKQNGYETPKKEYKEHTVIPIEDDSGKKEVSYN